MSTTTRIRVSLPEFGVPAACPTLPEESYERRLDAFAKRTRAAGFDAAIVVADRERSANIAWLTGFDPRFEEAILVQVSGGEATVLTGPENGGFALQNRAPITTLSYPPLGVPGSDRSHTRPLSEILSDLGIRRGMRIGIVGGKYFGKYEAPEPETWSDAPAYIVDVLRSIAGDDGAVVNATRLMTDPETGLRAINDIDQLAVFEFGAAQSSEAIRRVLFGLRVGMSEFEAARLMQPIGLPVSCHPMFASGPRSRWGLNGPSGRLIERGDPVSFGYGLWGGFHCRAGWVVADESELLPDAKRIADVVVGRFFSAAVLWYEMIDIGVKGGDIDAKIRRHLKSSGIDLLLNPGHLIGHEEWLNTPIRPRSEEKLASGHALQCDMIPIVQTGEFTCAMEDGIFLLDERGRAAFAERFPEAWERILARRAFMEGTLGIRLAPSVLPTSNIPAYLPSFLLDPGRVFAKE